MFINGIELTLENYKEIFKVCTPDVLDEIRLAILDDTDILAYINPCGNDSYKLGQFRLATREGVSFRYLVSSLSGKAVNKIRACHRMHMDMTQLLRYINGGHIKISNEMFELVASAVSLGADITKVDFTQVKEDTCKVICEGLVRKYPMWLFVGDNLSEKYIRTLMRGMDLGIDISPCITNIYSESQLIYIFAHKEYSNILRYITPKFPLESIKILMRAVEDGLDISELVYRDGDGYPVYSEFQLDALVKALKLRKLGVVVDDVFDPKLSDFDMLNMLDSYVDTDIDVLLLSDRNS